MLLHECLLGRRTVYRYLNRPVPVDVIERALDAARWAPNHKLTEPWRFAVAGSATRQRLGDVAERLALKKAQGLADTARDEMVAKQRRKIVDVPVIILVSVLRTSGDALREKEDYAATCCAVQNLVLSLWADGVGAQWSTGGIIRDPATYEILGLSSQRLDMVGLIKAGYPQAVPESRRLPLADVVTRLP